MCIRDSDKLVRENFGQSEYVRPNEDIEERVGKLYGKMESPVLTGVTIEFRGDDAPANATFAGDGWTCLLYTSRCV